MTQPRRGFALRLALLGIFVFAPVQKAQETEMASLSVSVLDAATGRQTPVRVLLEDSDGNRPRVAGATAVSESPIPVPQGAIPVMWGRNDSAQGYYLQPDGSFYADGSFATVLPPGSYKVTISKGFEYVTRTYTLNLDPGALEVAVFPIERWIDMPARGWYSADDHIHLQRSPRDNPGIVKWLAAEDIHVGNILEMGDFWTTYFTQYAFGDAGRYQEENHIITPGQEEPRTPEIGHTISLGGSALVRLRDDYYSYDRLFDGVHDVGGIAGFAHQGVLFHGYRGMTLQVPRNKVDFLELMQFCAEEGPLEPLYYYHFLNLGFRLTALAGSDFPWCGRGPVHGVDVERHSQIGDARFYSYLGGELTFESWFEAVQAGRTFATTGPMLLLEVNGRPPGDTLDVPEGTPLRISATALGHVEQIPLRSLEIIAHGEVIGSVNGAGETDLSTEIEIPASHGIWIAARAEAGPGQSAHTTPIYVTVDGGGFHNPAAIADNVELSETWLRDFEEYLAAEEAEGDRQATRHRMQLERQIQEARDVLRGLSGQR